ncbi:EscV/YscV/HrcV family type III secretion system export apparatus protein [Arthrobacter livingstonensis]|uniref:EscV/YscV/HrcV family type III secretion system export apparatus protein n=1 Tax=Arthrobacter livingstonensis TaxID=670078 RepID=A0A2V5L5S5_9MICC|nr:flagellar biosynthesis protein FlhA [Arthrobacter livingstonensis]PYI66871.1 EscV/YscV/HrcV family type III secretion system export apparatus protein [Arthrobacter livingstonensis]
MNRNFSKLAVPMGVVGIVLLLVVPIPAVLLDVLLIISIVFALLVLMNSMFVKKPLDFSVFPSLLLVATLFRLGLNVASTRLVLGQAHAGAVIQAFGEVTVGGNLIIGGVIFLILVVIQFVVVTKGAERVAEVGARFTLDAMPGKQMAIDADLNAGLITDIEAKERRVEVSAEADFYGAMDGASKFVKGDAIVGIIIIIINLVGGIAIGMLQRGMDITDAVNTYSLLSIGDGLVTQIPALLMAVATGMIVTRSNASSDMGTTAAQQLTQSRSALLVAGTAAIIMSVIPGMPIFLFLAVGAVLLFIGQRVGAADTAAAAAAVVAAVPAPQAETTEDIIERMRVQALEIQLSTDLVDLVSGSADDLLARIKALRHKVAMEMGMVVPPVRTRDHVELPPSTYVIRIAGVEAGRGTAPAGRVLALGEQLGSLPGTPTVEPVFGLAGKWIPAEMRHSAEMAGATVIDRVSVLITHLSAVVSANAARLLSREDVRVLTEGVKEVSPSIVEELVPGMLSLGEVQRVLQGLLGEQVPINDLPRIYEALSLQAKKGTEPEPLVESARTALGPVIVDRYLDGGSLAVLMIDPSLEQSLLEGLRPSELGTQIVVDPSRMEAFLVSVTESFAAAETAGHSPVLVCAPALRPAVWRLVSGRVKGLPVLSYTEATAGNPTIDTVGVVRSVQSISA